MSVPWLTLPAMWQDPTALWRRLKLGREEYLQRLVTTLILDGVAPPWNAPQPPGQLGRRFLQLLDDVAHGQPSASRPVVAPNHFVDEYLLPKLDEGAANGWPDWAVLWDDRVWIIELKTEAGSHRADQLPYYLRLAAAAHPRCSIDLTYITGPLTKPAPALLDGQRYSHLTWDQVVPLIREVWGLESRPEVTAYVEMISTVVNNLDRLKPSTQREAVIGIGAVEPTEPTIDGGPVQPAPRLLDLASATATDGRQRGVGAQTPEELEALRDQARAEIDDLAPDDVTRFVLPWLWRAGRTDGRALTREGQEFGYELRFSRYKTLQVRPKT